MKPQMKELKSSELAFKKHPVRYDSFLYLLADFSDYLRFYENISIEPHSSHTETRARFQAFPAQQQELILTNFTKYYETCREMIENGHSLRDKARSILTHLKLHKLRIPADAITFVTEGNCVELYDRNCVQTYRSPDFFRLTSHSLEDLLVRPYPELFDRNEESGKQCMDAVVQTLSGQSKLIKDFCPEHVVKEINSEKRIISKAKSIICCALMSEVSDEVLGFMHVFEVKNQHYLSTVH